MSDINDTICQVKITKLENSKAYSIWRIYGMELMGTDGVIAWLSENAPRGRCRTVIVSQANRMDEKVRNLIVMNLSKEQASLVTSVLI